MVKIEPEEVKKILIITLSNIGDVVLTLPVLGVLKREFPRAEITVMVGANAKELFEAEPAVSRTVIYDKKARFSKKIELGLMLRRRGFDLVVDLRNSLFPLLIGARHNTPLFVKRAGAHMHRKDKHLKRIAAMGIPVDNPPFSVSIARDDKLHVHSLLNQLGILPDDDLVAVAPGAKSHIKRWTTAGFIKVCDRLNKELGLKVLLIGDDSDRPINEQIRARGLRGAYDLSGRTSLRELAYLLSLCKLLITNDSAPLHIGSAVGIPTIAIFGPTDYKKYGPLSANSILVRKPLNCSPCQKALCRFNLECMKQVSVEEIFIAALEILSKT